jgi:hypothetical protein
MIWLIIATIVLLVVFALGALLHSLCGYGQWR